MIRLRVACTAMASLMSFGVALAEENSGPQIILPLPDAERGRFLFASKGCVVCHSINGVGGKAGPALDAAEDARQIDPLEFAARMWKGAVAMSILQSMEFGYQVEMSGDDIADLAAFVANPRLQAEFSQNDVPEVMLGWTIDEPFPMDEAEWSSNWPGNREADLAEADTGDVERGEALAQRWCTSCHVIAPNGEGGDAGPAFESLAARPDLTIESVLSWLSEPHPSMPEFLNLDDADFVDLGAYITSLQQ